MKKYRKELQGSMNQIFDEIEIAVNNATNEIETIMQSKDSDEIAKCAKNAWEMLNSLAIGLH